jgi:hypothetical protein
MSINKDLYIANLIYNLIYSNKVIDKINNNFDFHELNDIDKLLLYKKNNNLLLYDLNINYYDYILLNNEYLDKLTSIQFKKINFKCCTNKMDLLKSSKNKELFSGKLVKENVCSNLLKFPKGINTIDYSCLIRYEIFENDIPYGVKKVILSDYFNDELRYIPDTVIDLTIGNSFNKPIQKGVLNNNLKSLSIGNPEILRNQSYNHVLQKNVLPNNLINLYIGIGFSTSLNVGVLPKTLKKLILAKYHYPLHYGVIPENVEYLSLSSFNYRLNIGDLPSKIKYLYLYLYDNILEHGVIPNCVEILELSNFNKFVKTGVLPNSLIKLTLQNYSYSIYPNTLPSKLKYLNLWPNSNGNIIKKSFPNSLTHLILGNHYNQELNNDILPQSLIYLKIGKYYSNKIFLSNIPPNLIEICVYNYYNYNILDNEIFKNIPIISFGRDDNLNHCIKKISNNNENKTNLSNEEIEHTNYVSMTNNEQNSLLNKNIIINKISNIFDVPHLISLMIYKEEKNQIDNSIVDIYQYGTKGNIINEELLKTVFNPQRLIRLSNLYNIDIDTLLNYY